MEPLRITRRGGMAQIVDVQVLDTGTLARARPGGIERVRTQRKDPLVRSTTRKRL